MAERNDGGPAFPVKGGFAFAYPEGATEDIKKAVKESVEREHGGMSLRDWFAGQAMAGMWARDTFDPGQATPEQRASLAYIDADAMLAQRAKLKEQDDG